MAGSCFRLWFTVICCDFVQKGGVFIREMREGFAPRFCCGSGVMSRCVTWNDGNCVWATSDDLRTVSRRKGIPRAVALAKVVPGLSPELERGPAWTRARGFAFNAGGFAQGVAEARRMIACASLSFATPHSCHLHPSLRRCVWVSGVWRSVDMREIHGF